MTRLFIILPLFVLFLPCSVAAQEEVPWLSLSRLSIAAATSYHFSPWKKYNESLQLAQDAIRYNFWYQVPRGSFEKILGDGSVELSAGYRLIEGLSVNIIAGYTSTSSDGNFVNANHENLYPNGAPYTLERAINQNIRLNVQEYGLGFRYEYEITGGIHLFGLASVNQAYGNLSFEYEYMYAYDLQALGARYFYSVELQDKKLSYHVGLGAVIHLYDFLSLTSSVEYRWLKLPDFYGVGTYRFQNTSANNGYEQNESFEASLGEADGYFGIHILSFGPPPEYILHTHLSNTTAQLWWATHKPETFDLSGIGVKIGVQIEF